MAAIPFKNQFPQELIFLKQRTDIIQHEDQKYTDDQYCHDEQINTAMFLLHETPPLLQDIGVLPHRIDEHL